MNRIRNRTRRSLFALRLHSYRVLKWYRNSLFAPVLILIGVAYIVSLLAFSDIRLGDILMTGALLVLFPYLHLRFTQVQKSSKKTRGQFSHQAGGINFGEDAEATLIAIARKEAASNNDLLYQRVMNVMYSERAMIWPILKEASTITSDDLNKGQH